MIAGYVDVDVTPDNWVTHPDKGSVMAIAVHRWVDRSLAERARGPKTTDASLTVFDHVATTISVQRPNVVFRMVLSDDCTGAEVRRFATWAKAGLAAEIESIPSDAMSEYGKANRERREAK